jgi:hypothetical protein
MISFKSVGLATASLCALTAMLYLAGCGNQCYSGYTGFGNTNGLGCGGGPPIPPQTTMEIEGTPGTAFTGIISDTVASYTFSGVVPMGVVYVNNTPPVRLVVTNKNPLPSVISIEGLIGGAVAQLATSNIPGGSVTVDVPKVSTTLENLAAFAPAAQCDVRFYVNSPAGDYYQSLIEDQATNFGFQNATVAPTLYFLGQAKGTVSGVFIKTTNYTLKPLTVDLTVNGEVKTTQVSTHVLISSGCP